MYKKEKKTRKVGVVVGLIKNFRRSLLGEERKESEKRETILYHFPFLAFFSFFPPKTPSEFLINTSTTIVHYTI